LSFFLSDMAQSVYFRSTNKCVLVNGSRCRFNLVPGYFFKDTEVLELRNPYDFDIVYQFEMADTIHPDYTPISRPFDFAGVVPTAKTLEPGRSHFYAFAIEAWENERQFYDDDWEILNRLRPSLRYKRPIYELFFSPCVKIYGPPDERLNVQPKEWMNADALLCCQEWEYPFFTLNYQFVQLPDYV
jgi:hypothetical protein